MRQHRVFRADTRLDFEHGFLVAGGVDLLHQRADLGEPPGRGCHGILQQCLLLVRLGEGSLAACARSAREVEAVVDHARVAQRLARRCQPAVPGSVDAVDDGVDVGGDVVSQSCAVEHVAEVSHSVDAGDLALQLPNLLDLVLDLGDVVDHLLDRLDQVRDVDDGDALRVAWAAGQRRSDGESGDAKAMLHVESR